MSDSVWDTYPADYRAAEAQAVQSATQAGESVAVVGLSGAGKSNLLGFLAHRHSGPGLAYHLVDGNRLLEPSPTALFRLMCRALGEAEASDEAWEALDRTLTQRLSEPGSSLTFLVDRFDALPPEPGLFSSLRALRDAHKYQLSFVLALRRPLAARNELAELVSAHTLWLGPLSVSDARWTVARYAARRNQEWDVATVALLLSASGRYPAFLRAACEAVTAGCALDPAALGAHPAVRQRIAEFWVDAPNPEDLARSGLAGHPWLERAGPPESRPEIDRSRLTAKEHRLLEYFLAHPDQVCEKDALIQAVWPEDRVFTQGVRDDSLAQLVRRLREKIEPNPAAPRYIQTAPGRGYTYRMAPKDVETH